MDWFETGVVFKIGERRPLVKTLLDDKKEIDRVWHTFKSLSMRDWFLASVNTDSSRPQFIFVLFVGLNDDRKSM